MGDAAHASSPHHGAGAGFGVEDCAVLASILDDSYVKTSNDLQSAFAAYDACRRERDQWLVQSSKRAGNVYEWRVPDIGRDFKKIEEDVRNRQALVWDYDIEGAITRARDDMRSRLSRETL